VSLLHKSNLSVFISSLKEIAHICQAFIKTYAGRSVRNGSRIDRLFFVKLENLRTFYCAISTFIMITILKSTLYERLLDFSVFRRFRMQVPIMFGNNIKAIKIKLGFK